ncbi:hypothetical protein HC931_26800 [Candidatus Gracilibacteria bacterium]|jgi:hypothetical protein|nr:hypothetical protein [Candidatus Gracilibacteria bacterium]
MRQPQWFQFLGSLGLEFWLPLPLLGLGFWAMSGWVADRDLSRPSQNVRELEISQPARSSSDQILTIKVTIDRKHKASLVEVKQATNIFQKRKFELSTTELNQIEAKISKKLDLSAEQVRQLVRYQISD